MFTPLGLLPPSQFRSRSPLFMREVARTSHHRRGAFATWKVRPYRGSVISVPPYSHTAAPSTVYFLYGLGPFACSYTCPYRAYTAFFRGLLYALAHALIRGVCVDELLAWGLFRVALLWPPKIPRAGLARGLSRIAPHGLYEGRFVYHHGIRSVTVLFHVEYSRLTTPNPHGLDSYLPHISVQGVD